MKKLFFVIWGDPKFYQTIIFLSQYLSEKNYESIYAMNLLNLKRELRSVIRKCDNILEAS